MSHIRPHPVVRFVEACTLPLRISSLAVLLGVAASPAAAQVPGDPRPAGSAFVRAELAPGGVDLVLPAVPRSAQARAPKHAMPPLPIADAGLPAPNSPPLNTSATLPTAGCDLIVRANHDVAPPGSGRGTVAEPTVALRGTNDPFATVGFYTANWFAGLSNDSGVTWSHVNPSTRFAALDGGFCCDQTCLYVPVRDAMVWYLQYSYSATTQRGSVRVAYAIGSGIAGNQWASFVFSPQGFGMSPGYWFDFPDIAVSNSHIYFTSNVFDPTGGFVDAVIWTMSLDDFLGGSGAVTWWIGANIGGAASVRFTRGLGDTLYAGTHASNSRIRIFKLIGASLVVVERDHPAWSGGPYVSMTQGGVNWAGRIDWRMTGAYQTPVEYGFLWTASATSGRPLPYTRVARFRTSDDAHVADEDLWSNDVAVMYASAAGNDAGQTAFSVAFGGASTHPRTACGLVDDCTPNWAGQTLQSVVSPTASPSVPKWGDYYSVQRHPVRSLEFVGSAAGLVGGGADHNQQTRLAWWGRERDNPAWVTTSVWSAPVQGVPITCTADRLGKTRVTSVGYVSYDASTNYVLTAPTAHVADGKVYRFREWRYRGAPHGSLAYYSSATSTLFIADARDDVAQAVYEEARRLEVGSRMPATGVAIAVTPNDVQNNGNGTTVFARHYLAGAGVTLTAPATHGTNPFKRWWLDGVAQPLGTRALLVNVGQGATPIVAEAEFFEHVAGAFTAFCSGCPGTGNRVPVHGGSGTPEIGQSIQWLVSNARGNSSGILRVGASRTTWNGLSLPVNLGFLGMGSTCLLCVSPDLALPFVTDSAGAASLGVLIPNDIALVRSRIYTQPAIIDGGAPSTLPLVHGNALELLVGGTI